MFEFGVGGHYPQYLRYLVEHWHAHGFGHLHIVIRRRFLSLHGSILNEVCPPDAGRVSYSLIDEDDETVLEACLLYSYGIGSKPEQQLKAFHGSISAQFWSLVQKYGARFPARHMLLMNLDECLVALSAGQRAPVDFSGIFFRPGFLYRDSVSADKFDVFGALQERLVLQRLLKHPQLRAAFFLDRAVSARLAGQGTTEVVYLPDPVRLPEKLLTREEVEGAKAKLAVGRGRRLVTIIGDIAPRKGLYPLIEALRLLAPAEQRQVCLALVGSSADQNEERLAPALTALAQETEVQVIRRRCYIDDAEMRVWFAASTVIAAPYTRHVGMSGILLLAAAFGRPVISQEFGLMGRLVEEHGLGLTVDPVNRVALADAVRMFLAPQLPPAWDPRRAAAFARQHSHEQFASKLFGTIQKYLA